MREKICGIYMIQNTVNGKVYIGQSADVIERFGRHRSALHTNTPTSVAPLST